MKLEAPVFNTPKALFGFSDAALMELIEGVARETLSAKEATRLYLLSQEPLEPRETVATAKVIVPEESVAGWFRHIAADRELLNDVRDDYRALIARTRDWWYKFREEELLSIRLEYGAEAAQKYKAQTDRLRVGGEEFWSEALTILEGKHPDLRWRNE